MVYDDLTEDIFKGKNILITASDHGYFGIYRGLEDPSILKPLLPYTDVVMTDLRVLRFLRECKKPIILRASGGSSVIDIPVPGYLQEPARAAYFSRTKKDAKEALQEYENRLDKLNKDEWEDYRSLHSIFYEPDELGNEKLILTSHEADVVDAKAVAVSVYLGTRYQTQTLDNLATTCREAHERGMPVLGVLAVGKQLGYLEQDSDFLMKGGVILSAHGADFIKMYNPRNPGSKPSFKDIVVACGVPVVVAGGRLPEGKNSTEDTLELAYDSLENGAKGLDFGRRIWRHDNPVPMLRALRDIIDGKDVSIAEKNFHKYKDEQRSIDSKN